MTFASATFTGTAFAELSSVDANFSKQTGYTQDLILGSTGAYLICNHTSNIGVYQHSATPPTANYSVKADIAKLSGATTPQMAVCGRMAPAADTYYFLQYSHDVTNVRLFKRVAGSSTQLGSSYSMTLTSTPVEIELVMDGDQISGYVDGVLRIGPVTDSAITAAGKAGVRMINTRESGVADSGSLDNFVAAGISPPSEFVAGATLGAVVASGTMQAIASAFVAGATLGAVAGGGSLGPAPGVLTSQPLRTNNGTLLADTALDYVDVYAESSGVFVARFTGLSTNGAGVFQITSASLTPGTVYKLDWRTGAGHRRMPTATAA